MSPDLAPIIAAHGHAVLTVQTRHPAMPAWSYTVGRTERGRPELVVFDLDQHTAGAVLDELVRLDDAGIELQPDGEVDLWPGHASIPVRLGTVRPRHVPRYVPAALEAAAGHPVPLVALQVGLPGASGELPRTGLVTCACCPDLTRAGGPWRGPYDPRAISFRAESGPQLDVCLPVVDPDGNHDRVEVVPCRALDEDTVEVLDPPVLADWATTGTVLELADQPHPSGMPFAAVARRRSPMVHLTWWIHRHLVADRGQEGRLCAALDGLADIPRTSVTWADDWLAAATLPTHAERARSRMRHLVRDGLLAEATPYSVDGGPCTDPHCRGCDLP